MNEVCVECKYNYYSYKEREFICGYVESNYYGIPTAYDDSCVDFEHKKERKNNEFSNIYRKND